MRKPNKKNLKQKDQTKQKQKQKQTVSVNVNIDQSKRTVQRKQKETTQKMQPPPPFYHFPPPTYYQPPHPPQADNILLGRIEGLLKGLQTQPQQQSVYGLTPVSNTSSSMSETITKEQNANMLEVLLQKKSEPALRESLFNSTVTNSTVSNSNNLSPVSTSTNSLGISIQKENLKRDMQTPQHIKDWFLKLNEEYDRDLEQYTKKPEKVQFTEDNEIIPQKLFDNKDSLQEDENINANEVDDADKLVPEKKKETKEELAIRKHNEYERRKEKEKENPMVLNPNSEEVDLNTMLKKDLQNYAKTLNIPIYNSEKGGKGSKKEKNKDVLITEIRSAQKAIKSTPIRNTEDEENVEFNTPLSGKKSSSKK